MNRYSTLNDYGSASKSDNKGHLKANKRALRQEYRFSAERNLKRTGLFGVSNVSVICFQSIFIAILLIASSVDEASRKPW